MEALRGGYMGAKGRFKAESTKMAVSKPFVAVV